MNPEIREPHVESSLSLALGGLLTLGFGTLAVLLALGIGWVAAAVLGAALLVLARTVPTRPSARTLPYLMAGLGVMSLAAALVELLA